MKRHIALLASLLLLSGAAAVAQEYVPTPVTISSEKVKFNGKVYYAHPVLERQTLFSISKAYGVTENDLYEANPSLRETGLQKGTILLIPMKQKDEDKASRKERAAQAGFHMICAVVVEKHRSYKGYICAVGRNGCLSETVEHG